MNRRSFLLGVGTAALGGLAGCTDYGYGECYGDCESVEEISIDSEGSLVGRGYTHITVTFTEPFTGTIAAKTYRGHELNGYKEVDVGEAMGYTIKFNTEKTGGQYKVFLDREES